MSPDTLKYFANYIEAELGIFFHESNLYQLKVRIEEMAFQENVSVPELEALFKRGPSATLKRKFLDHATNNETLFFRDPPYFAAIAKYIVSDILPTGPRELKFWSAACSKGQEAISLAICLDELSRTHTLPPYSIIASDISEKVLLKARSGTYTDLEVKRGLSDERKKAYFTQVADGWKVNQKIFSKITFVSNNLTKPTVTGPFDLILCRNVLIYQKIELKKVVVESLLNNLTLQGALLLGVGETLLGITENPNVYNQNGVTFYRHKNAGTMKKAI